ncbi:hypothetical protein J6590_072226 [Homalodisca vitripennis]|nr:hypothetical protein J6590_072226 [Homalodisca vitripennis]
MKGHNGREVTGPSKQTTLTISHQWIHEWRQDKRETEIGVSDKTIEECFCRASPRNSSVATAPARNVPLEPVWGPSRSLSGERRHSGYSQYPRLPTPLNSPPADVSPLLPVRTQRDHGWLRLCSTNYFQVALLTGLFFYKVLFNFLPHMVWSRDV